MNKGLVPTLPDFYPRAFAGEYLGPQILAVWEGRVDTLWRPLGIGVHVGCETGQCLERAKDSQWDGSSRWADEQPFPVNS